MQTPVKLPADCGLTATHRTREVECARGGSPRARECTYSKGTMVRDSDPVASGGSTLARDCSSLAPARRGPVVSADADEGAASPRAIAVAIRTRKSQTHSRRAQEAHEDALRRAEVRAKERGRDTSRRAARSRKEATISFLESGGELNPGPEFYGFEFSKSPEDVWFGFRGVVNPGAWGYDGRKMYRGQEVDVYHLLRDRRVLAVVHRSRLWGYVTVVLAPVTYGWTYYDDLLACGDVEPNPGPGRTFKVSRHVSEDDYIKAKVPKCRFDGEALAESELKMCGKTVLCRACGVNCEGIQGFGSLITIHPCQRRENAIAEIALAPGSADDAFDPSALDEFTWREHPKKDTVAERLPSCDSEGIVPPPPTSEVSSVPVKVVETDWAGEPGYDGFEHTFGMGVPEGADWSNYGDVPLAPSFVPPRPFAIRKLGFLKAGLRPVGPPTAPPPFPPSDRDLRSGHHLRKPVEEETPCLSGYLLQTDDEFNRLKTLIGCPAEVPFTRTEFFQTIRRIPFKRDSRIATNRNVKIIEQDVEVADVLVQGRQWNYHRVWVYVVFAGAIIVVVLLNIIFPLTEQRAETVYSVCSRPGFTFRAENDPDAAPVAQSLASSWNGLVDFAGSSLREGVSTDVGLRRLFGPLINGAGRLVYSSLKGLQGLTSYDTLCEDRVIEEVPHTWAGWMLLPVQLLGVLMPLRFLFKNVRLPPQVHSSLIVPFTRTVTYCPAALTCALVEYRPGADVADVEQKLMRQASLPIPADLYLQVQRGTAVAACATSPTVQSGFRHAHDHSARVVGSAAH